MSGVLCAPVGLTGAPSCRYWCVCGEQLYPVRMAPSVNDWAYEDGQGLRSVAIGPKGFEGDPYGYLEYLQGLFYDPARKKCLDGPQADCAAREYSSVSAAVCLGSNLFRHYHRTDTSKTERLSGDPWKCPECCGSPMWASPDGWACRVNKTLFPYQEGA